jgi:hypothetical protein
MTVTDDGKWQIVSRRAYMAFLRTHPRREQLRRARFNQGEGRGPMWYVFDSGAFEADNRPIASTTSHIVALRVIWLESDGGDGRMRYWIPAPGPADATVEV